MLHLVGKPASVPCSFNPPSPLCFGSKQGCVRSSWASHSPPVSPTSPPTSQGDLSSWCWTPGLGLPICGSNCSLPREVLHPWNLPPFLSPLPGAQVPTWSLFFPSCLIPRGSFLQPWLYKGLSASLQVVFSENYSTCRCIFDVFVRGGEFHCSPTLPSWSLFNRLYFF